MYKPKIQIKDVEKTFLSSKGEAQAALKKVNLNIEEGEFICLLGPSGCGKTTLLNLIAGFEIPTKGEVLIDGLKVTKPDPKHITIFQDYGLFPWRTVLGNVEYGLECKGVPKEERKIIAEKYVDLVGLKKFSLSHPHELSGGMKQRVAIARALAVDPDVIFMDEPFGALDAITRMKMQEEIIALWQEKKVTIIFVTHDIDEAIFLADKIVVMTPHPGQMKVVVNVPLGRPRKRTEYDFSQMRDRIYQELELKHEDSPEYFI